MTVAATDQVTVRCSLGCDDWLFEGEREEAVESALWHREQVHKVAAPSSGRLPLNGGYGFSIEGGTVNGLDALERMDRGERQEPLGEEEPGRADGDDSAEAASLSAAPAEAAVTASSPSPNGRGKWTRESIVDAIKDYADQHGHAPASHDVASCATAAKRIFGSWGDAVVAAGFDRPQRGVSRKLTPGGGFTEAEGDRSAQAESRKALNRSRKTGTGGCTGAEARRRRSRARGCPRGARAGSGDLRGRPRSVPVARACAADQERARLLT